MIVPSRFLPRNNRCCPQREGFTLASVLVLIALSAILLALFRSVIVNRTEVFNEQVAVNAVAGFVAGLFLGGAIAASYDFGIGRVLIGIVAGGGSGLVAGLLSGMDYNTLIALAGAAILLIMSSVVRAASSAAPPTPAGSASEGHDG